MMKRLIAVVLAALLMIGIAGCGAAGPKQADTAAEETPIATPGATAAPTPEATPAPTATPIPAANPDGAQMEVPEGEAGMAKMHDFDYNGTKRSYVLYIPKGIREGAPLVFVLHGYLGFASSFMTFTGMNDVADEGGFGVVYPQGLSSGDAEFPGTCWNADFTFTEADDVGFLTALAADLQERYGFSSSETFASGLSNGGFMSYTLAVKSPGTFRAIASVVGTMSKGTWDDRDAAVPIPVLQISGTADTTVPIDGTMTVSGGWGGAPPMDEIMQFWAETDGTDTMTEKVSGIVNARLYAGSDSENRVWYYLIDGFGHNWPTTQNAGLNASELIWRFFFHYVE